MQLIETQIENGLSILDEKEASLIELRERFSSLSIVDVNDKDGFKAVRDARLECKRVRVSVEKDGKALRENAVKFQKAVIKREDDLIAIIAPVERKLEAMEEKYNAWQEEIRIQKEREEQARISERVNKLAKFNYGIDLYDLTIMPDDKFNELLTQVEVDYNTEQERIAKDKAEAESARLAEEQRQAELRAIHEENMRKEREEIARQKAEFEQREATLKALREKEIAEQRERENQIKAEREKLEAEKAELRRQQELKETEERARKEEAERIEREAKEKAERERLAELERHRQEALKPDKDKLLRLAQELSIFPMPEVSSDEAKAVIQHVEIGIAGACDYLVQKSKTL